VADLRFDGQTWEVKYINEANVKTIRWYIEQVRKKGAHNGIFYWDKNTKLSALNAALYSEVGKLRKFGRISEMPAIYYMDKSGLLRVAWKK
jgi:hypothetical protein